MNPLIVLRGPAQKKKGSHKAGRNKVKCANYRASRSYNNKLRKLRRHLDHHAADTCAQTAIQRARASV